ncbi:hypothetical protein BESB_077140 [Besnoitia besnoiti]|uniref:Inhibitor of cysteine protease 2 n=1 Tax=Besnoitia besnoiti TaxID=94643 RepID=A0A2A9MD19_BESBE|nr:hypothetical protein BESB_077140 [Besnoitia besnoiti]PFH33497.1 hypothetical protein BESB_077140 [Besnoitia besnoiti]
MEMFRRQFFSVFLLLVLSASSLNSDRFAGAADSSETEDNMKTVMFEGPPKDNVYEAELHLESTPSEAKVVIKSSAGSGGYTFMAYDIFEGNNELPKLHVQALPEDEMKKRLEAPVSKHGVTLTKPAVENVNKMPGAPQTYEAMLKVERPGNYVAVIGRVRPWSPTDGASFYVVRIRATE